MIYYVDGFNYGGNPSDKGGGFTICDEAGKLVLQEERLKAGFTNNEGELLAAVFAAALAGPGDTILTDSMNTLAWLKYGKCKARPDLRDVCKLGYHIIKQKNLTLQWIPREQNLAGRLNDEMHERLAVIQSLL